MQGLSCPGLDNGPVLLPMKADARKVIEKVTPSLAYKCAQVKFHFGAKTTTINFRVALLLKVKNGRNVSKNRHSYHGIYVLIVTLGKPQ